jgi:hypothetical protein
MQTDIRFIPEYMLAMERRCNDFHLTRIPCQELSAASSLHGESPAFPDLSPDSNVITTDPRRSRVNTARAWEADWQTPIMGLQLRKRQSSSGCGGVHCVVSRVWRRALWSVQTRAGVIPVIPALSPTSCQTPPRLMQLDHLALLHPRIQDLGVPP